MRAAFAGEKPFNGREELDTFEHPFGLARGLHFGVPVFLLPHQDLLQLGHHRDPIVKRILRHRPVQHAQEEVHLRVRTHPSARVHHAVRQLKGCIFAGALHDVTDDEFREINVSHIASVPGVNVGIIHLRVGIKIPHRRRMRQCGVHLLLLALGVGRKGDGGEGGLPERRERGAAKRRIPRPPEVIDLAQQLAAGQIDVPETAVEPQMRRDGEAIAQPCEIRLHLRGHMTGGLHGLQFIAELQLLLLQLPDAHIRMGRLALSHLHQILEDLGPGVLRVVLSQKLLQLLGQLRLLRALHQRQQRLDVLLQLLVHPLSLAQQIHNLVV
mmetsp:Transcript_28106/g.47747  ORF Transcript_28106/g.47747 Transcript_28106/m.47747 type:complete len:326 (-) Transcript_28106:1320-2297(-)